MKITKYILSLAVLIAALGCQRRPLEYFYKPEAKIICLCEVLCYLSPVSTAGRASDSDRIHDPVNEVFRR